MQPCLPNKPSGSRDLVLLLPQEMTTTAASSREGTRELQSDHGDAVLLRNRSLASFGGLSSVGLRPSHSSEGSLAEGPFVTALARAGTGGVAEDLVIIPEQNVWLFAWDIFIVVILFITAFYEPFAVAVLLRDPVWAVVLNNCLDAIFSTDMVLQFFIAYARPVESTAGRSLWETDLRLIRARYCGIPLSQAGLAGWFWIDLMSVVPLFFSALHAAGALDHENAQVARVLVLLRVLRLVRITKLVRLAKYVQQGHALYGFPFYLVELLKFMLITSLTCHWLACVWIIVEGRVNNGKLSFKTENESWLSALIKGKGDPCYPDAARDPQCVYVIAIYWAMMTLTTVGYGDIVPQNSVEYVVCTVSMLIVAYVWAYIIAKIVNILKAMDPHEAEFRHRADALQRMMVNRNLPQELQVRLRSFLHAAKSTRQQQQQAELIEESISEGLQREIAQSSGVCQTFMQGVPWAADLQQDALLDLVRALFPRSFAPNEAMRLFQTLIVMRGGLAAARGQLLMRGDVWGQWDILLETPALIGKSMPRSVTYVDIVCLDKASLLQVCKSFPHADRRVRRAQIRTAVFRAFVQSARERDLRERCSSADDEANAARDGFRRRLRASRSHDFTSFLAGPEDDGACMPTGSEDPEAEAARRAAAAGDKRSAVTSFVNPGESRLEMPSLSRPARQQVELTDVAKLIQRLAERHAALEEKVIGMHDALQQLLLERAPPVGLTRSIA